MANKRHKKCIQHSEKVRDDRNNKKGCTYRKINLVILGIQEKLNKVEYGLKYKKSYCLRRKTLAYWFNLYKLQNRVN